MIGKRVSVIASADLEELRLNALIGCKGTIVALSNNNNGFYIELDEAYDGEKEWFIPRSALVIFKK